MSAGNILTSTPTIHIGDRLIGQGAPVFFIAEAGVNHNGDLQRAKALVDAAARAGADAVKFQTFKAEELVTRSAPKAQYQLQTTSAEESQLEMISKLELSADDHRELIAHCRLKNILFLSTPFDQNSVDLLEALKIPAFKIPSGEVTNWPFLEYVASKGKPVILSTGMSTLEEVEGAFRMLRAAGCDDLAILHCTSSYPAPPASVNLRAMLTLAKTFQVPVGLSDHTSGTEIAIAAAAMGASVLEKHFTLDRSLPGPDHRASLEPGELKALIGGIRDVESALGDGWKRPTDAEQDVKGVARRSIVSRGAIAPGTLITKELLAYKRPGTGIPPSEAPKVLGRRAARAIAADTVIRLEDLE